jgi:hypothetical protein
VRRLRISRAGELALMATMLASVAACGSTLHHTAATSTIIGHGRTLSGRTFIASVTPRASVTPLGGSGAKGSCPISLTIREKGYASFSEVCFSRMSVPIRPTAECVGQEWIIHVEAQQNARFMTLVLSNRRMVTSRIIRLPLSLGGPAALYFQAMAASGSRPTRLVERDQNGRVIGVLSILPPSRCEVATVVVRRRHGGAM